MRSPRWKRRTGKTCSSDPEKHSEAFVVHFVALDRPKPAARHTLLKQVEGDAFADL